MKPELIPHHASAGYQAGRRFEGGTMRRFAVVAPHADRGTAALRADHPAITEGRTVFTSTVVDAAESPRLLISGRNASKIGWKIIKGRWKGLPVYTLTLEERATCPRSCHEWQTCYGNSMHRARRHRHGREMELLLSAELAGLAGQHPKGFAVRLHVLGDFYSVRYASLWAVWLRWIPQLHVFGFTAHPEGAPIQQVVERLNGRFPDRCAIRFSRAEPSGQGWEATTIWNDPGGQWVKQGLVCPAQTGRTDCCGTCGLCWAKPLALTPIVFIGHGRQKRGRAAS